MGKDIEYLVVVRNYVDGSGKFYRAQRSDSEFNAFESNKLGGLAKLIVDDFNNQNSSSLGYFRITTLPDKTVGSVLMSHRVPHYVDTRINTEERETLIHQISRCES